MKNGRIRSPWSARGVTLLACLASACAVTGDGLEPECEVSALTDSAGPRIGSDDGLVRVESAQRLRTAPGVTLVPVNVNGGVVYRTIGGRPGFTANPRPTYVCACGGGTTCTGSCVVLTSGSDLNDCSGRCTAQGRACGSCAWRMQFPRPVVITERDRPFTPRNG